LKEEEALNAPPPAEGETPAEEPAADAPPKKTQEEITARREELVVQKDELETIIAAEQEDKLEVKYPEPVKEENKLNIAIVGPEKSGKTTLANYLAQEHQRGIVKLD